MQQLHGQPADDHVRRVGLPHDPAHQGLDQLGVRDAQVRGRDGEVGLDKDAAAVGAQPSGDLALDGVDAFDGDAGSVGGHGRSLG
ncbi:MAG: hypothetical protein ACP5G7_06435 [Anaerolineae bacterium]